MTPLIQVSNLRYRYGDGTEALKGIDLSFYSNQLCAVLGPNGSGKSTLFKILSTYVRDYRGHVSFKSEDVQTLKTKELRQKIGVCFQNPSIDPYLSCVENLICQGQVYGLSKGESRKRSAELLADFNLQDKANERASKLSGGMQRKLEIAKALMPRVELLLLDEPSTGLDPSSRKSLWLSLEKLVKNGVSVILTTHILEELDQVDQLCFLREGKVSFSGTPEDLRAELPPRLVQIKPYRLEGMRRKIQDEFGLRVSQLNGQIWVEEKDKDSDLMGQLLRRFTDNIAEITLKHPSYQDAYELLGEKEKTEVRT